MVVREVVFKMKNLDIYSLVLCFKILKNYYLFEENTLKNVLFRMVFWLTTFIVICGGLGYLVKQYQEGASIVDNSFVISLSLSGMVAICVLCSMQFNLYILLSIIHMIRVNPQLNLQNAVCMQHLERVNKMEKVLIVYILLAVFTQFCNVEIQFCDATEQHYGSCGLLVPSVRIYSYTLKIF